MSRLLFRVVPLLLLGLLSEAMLGSVRSEVGTGEGGKFLLLGAGTKISSLGAFARFLSFKALLQLKCSFKNLKEWITS